MTAPNRLRIPLEPYPKERPRIDRRHNRVYTPHATLNATKEHEAFLRANWHLPMVVDARVAVWLELYVHHQRGDLDNYAKLLLDAARGIVYRDDRQVEELHVSLSGAAGTGFTWLRVELSSPADYLRSGWPTLEPELAR